MIYTPNLEAPGYPDDRLIAVDLEHGVTRVLNSDYFGESKKGGLRMWNAKLVYDRGGLALHAGCKVMPDATRGEKVLLIIGLSGTGKTTTTFTTQNDSLPVQDDFVALMPGGKSYGTENGCFAKTFGLDPDYEPTIYGAVVKPDAYLENVSQDERRDGRTSSTTSYTQNGRAVFRDGRSRSVPRRDATIGTVDYLLILNRNENIIPAVAKLDQEQAAAYFMLGETQGTSAGGAAEAGKFLRVPGTNPFFPHRRTSCRATASSSCSATHPTRGLPAEHGPRRRAGDDDERSKKVQDPALLGDREGHRRGHDRVGPRTPTSATRSREAVPGIDDVELLQPRRLYERQGRAAGVPGDRRPPQGRARRAPREVPRAHARDRQGGRLDLGLVGGRTPAEEPPTQQLHRREHERHHEVPAVRLEVVQRGSALHLDRRRRSGRSRRTRTTTRSDP